MLLSFNHVIAAIQQLALGVTFLLIGVAARRYGDQAQQAAEQSVIDQGITKEKDFLLKHKVKFSESSAEMLLPLAIGVLLLTVGILNLTGSGLSRTLSWFLEPLLLVIVGSVTSGQVFVSSSLKRAFKKSQDAQLRQIDVDALMKRTSTAFPVWLQPLQVVRFALATVGSVVVMVMFALQK
ncbi:MAG: hypothetical protein J2P36_00495 [Ktedonobacteraceae bacterium]|nr:hypothetical protein [Ktedonobacteraceae bacterium]